MKIKAKINLICPTESGVSKSTGNPWSSRFVVVEVLEGERGGTMAVKTFSDDVIKKLDELKQGDVVTLDVFFQADYRSWTRSDGSIGEIRQTDVFSIGIEVEQLSGF